MTDMEPKSSRTVKGKIISHSVGKFQDGGKPISQDLLLSDFDFASLWDGDSFDLLHSLVQLRKVAKAQVQHLIDLGWRPSSLPNNPAWQTDEKLYEAFCAGQNSLISAGWVELSYAEPLIRAKVLKEIGEWIDKNTGKAVPTVIGYLIEQLKLGKIPKS